MTVRVGIVGIGTVGGGCVRIIQEHRDDFIRHYGIDLELARVCSMDIAQAEELGVQNIFTNDYNEVVNDPLIDIVVELIGGVTVAKDVVLKALNNGKYVVTANKALMATCGQEILDTAEKNNVEIMFEASVGGGIPIIGPLKHSLIANEISSVMGIVNGTTNYMLTRMSEDGLSYEEALAEAQANGFAEANPTADVDGFDAAAKIAILASIAFNTRVTMDEVFTRGITAIQPVDLETARDLGYAVKLLAIGHRTPEGIDVRVHPTMIPLDHQLAHIDGVFNGIYVVGDFVGETMFFGEGAGSGAAASAVMGDVLEEARHLTFGIKPTVKCTCTDDLPLVPLEDLEMRYYIRFKVQDRPGVLASMAAIFADKGVSLYSIMQKGREGADVVDLVYLTHHATERDVREAIDEIMALDGAVSEAPSVIRVEE